MGVLTPSGLPLLTPPQKRIGFQYRNLGVTPDLATTASVNPRYRTSPSLSFLTCKMDMTVSPSSGFCQRGVSVKPLGTLLPLSKW